MSTPDPSTGRTSRAGGTEWAVEVATAGGTDAELAADALWQAGAVAIEERPAAGGGGVVLVASGPADPSSLVRAVAGRWPAELVPVDGDAALDAWRPHARPVVAGRFVVRPPWVDAPDGGEIVVDIDPGRAFGSGSHLSTRLALRALGDLVQAGDRVLDVGCGSGVLAIATLAAGAAAAVGVDTDPAARDATLANADRNGVADRLTVVPEVADAPETRFDLVVANMLAPTLVELAPPIRARVGPGGRLVLSGLLAAQRTQVLAAYGDPTTTTYEQDGWLALALTPAQT